jgi:hypothetical protein
MRVTNTSGTTTLRSTSAKRRPGLGSKRANQSDRHFDIGFAVVDEYCQTFEIALGQHFHGLLAHLRLPVSRTCSASSPLGSSALSCSVKHSAKVACAHAHWL